MKLLLFCWKKDKAGLNIYNNLMKNFDFQETEKEFDGNKVFKSEKNGNEFLLTQTESFFYENWKEYNDLVNNLFADVDVVVSLVYHKGVSGSILTLHSLGNFDKNEISPAPAELMKSLIRYLHIEKEKLGLENFEVMQEVTHGYSIEFDKPIIDFEIGSNESDHTNDLAGKVLAFALMNLKIDNTWEAAIGLGGLHYATKFVKVQLQSKIAIGHIIPTSLLPKINKELLQNLIKKTSGEIKYLVMVKKEKGEYKQLSRKLAEELNLEFVTDGLACQTN